MRDEADGANEFEILDSGASWLDGRELRAAIRAILDGRISELARDRNAVCYRVPLSRRDGLPDAAIVKVPRPGPQRTNADASFAWEAAMLAALPAAGLVDAPALLARVAAAGGHFLFTAELPGTHPDARKHPLDGRQLRAILDGLYAMDRRSVMHYDLKPANILVDGARARFVDFEFARFEDAANAYAEAASTHCADFNVSGNPYFPARSNVANFEFRALHDYLLDVAAVKGADVADALHAEWLRSRAAYHARMADHLAALGASSASEIAIVSGITPEEARGGLLAAADYEMLLGKLLARPHPAAMHMERLVMAYRHAVFGRHADEALRTAAALRAEIDRGARTSGALPDAYRKATARTLELVGRSTHPAG